MIALAVLASVLAWAPCAPDSPGPRSHWEPLVQPATYASSDGSFRLHVRSLERDWRMGGHCRLERQGHVVWERELPFAMWDAEVLVDGRVVGLGFGDSAKGPTAGLLVSMFDAEGQLAWQFVEPEQARIVGMSLDPTYHVPGWGVQLDTERVLFELDPLAHSDSSRRRIRVLALESGADIGCLTLPYPEESQRGRHWLADLVVVADSGHLLALWRGMSHRHSIALYDGASQLGDSPMRELACWQAAVDEDLGGRSTGDSPFMRPRLSSRGVGEEPLAVVWESERTRPIQVTQRNDSWSLRVLDAAFVSDEVASLHPPLVELEELGPVALSIAANPESTEAVHRGLSRIEAFGFDEQGNVEVISTVDSQLVARTLDRQGRVLHTADLELTGVQVDYRCVWADGPDATWLLADVGTSGATIQRIDVRRGVSETLMYVEHAPSAMVAFEDGGFALVSSRRRLRCFDAHGHSVSAEDEVEEGEFRFRLLGRSLAADAIVLEKTQAGTVRLRILANGGREHRLVALAAGAEMWEEHRFDAILQLREGSFWLASTATGFGVIHTTLTEVDYDGRVLTRIQPHLVDGACFPLDYKSLEVAPDGSFWSANDDVVAMLSENGDPGPLLGRHFDPPRWDYARSWTIDRTGRILVQATKRGAYIFDLEGRSIGHMQVPSTLEKVYSSSFSVDGAGVTWWQLGLRDPFARFGAGGEFLGIRHLGSDAEVRFFGEGSERWTHDSRQIVRMVARHRVLERFTKRPDGAWWRYISEIEVSPDGRRLVVSDHLRAGGRAEGALLACYDFEAGEPWFVEAPQIAAVSLAGDWVLWGDRLIHWPTRAVRAIELEGAQVVETPRGPEIWLFEPGEDRPGRFRRFAVPEPG